MERTEFEAVGERGMERTEFEAAEDGEGRSARDRPAAANTAFAEEDKTRGAIL
jgi:hypothetical protein